MKRKANESTRYDFFISYSTKDRTWTRRLYNGLVERGYSVFFDEFSIKAGENIWERINDGLDRSRHLLMVLSKDFVRSDWCSAEACGARWSDPLNRKQSVIPILLEDCRKPKVLLPIKHIDARNGKGVAAVVGEIGRASGVSRDATRVRPGGVSLGRSSKVSRRMAISKSLALRLKYDFFETGPKRGQFCAIEGPVESQYWQSGTGEDLRVKPAYYHTYWGWRAAQLVNPGMLKVKGEVTVDGIIGRFGGKRWIQVELSDYGGQRENYSRTAETVRHTIRAAEILMLLGRRPELVWQVAWDLILEEGTVRNVDGGWKELRGESGGSSLSASLYAFRFLSECIRRAKRGIMFGDQRLFLRRAERLRREVEDYLLGQWRQNQWRLDKVPSEVNGPISFIDYAPYATRKDALEEIYETVDGFVHEGGRLVAPHVGEKCKTSEFKLSLRTAYALGCTDELRRRKNSKRDALEKWILTTYTELEALNTCDLAFLGEILVASRTSAR